MKLLVRLVDRGRTEHSYVCCTSHAATDPAAKRGPGKHAIDKHSYWLVTAVGDDRTCDECDDNEMPF